MHWWFQSGRRPRTSPGLVIVQVDTDAAANVLFVVLVLALTLMLHLMPIIVNNDGIVVVSVVANDAECRSKKMVNV